MPEDPAHCHTGNPYRRPRPSEIIAGGKFYLANEKGSYGFNTSAVKLALCRDYLWVSDTLSIPLAAITATGLSKHGGFVHFWDEISRQEIAFNFTKIGFLRFKRKKVDAFLADVRKVIEEQAAESQRITSATIESIRNIGCEVCGSTEANVILFRTFSFVGIAPFAYSYKLTPIRFVLCREHAGTQALKCCIRIALTGYLGFPGFIAAPWYIVTNLWSLRRADVADLRTVLLSLVGCICIPLGLIACIITLMIEQLNS